MISHNDAVSIFNYDPETGIFTNKIRRSMACKAGDVAGWEMPGGYIRITIGQSRILAHRLAWLFVYGDLPKEQIDHINGDRSDNRISNLRLASADQNARNKRISKNNTSGFKGVSYSPPHKKFVARIMVDRKNNFLGLFDTAEDAHAAYVTAAYKLHGDFANPGYSAIAA